MPSSENEKAANTSESTATIILENVPTDRVAFMIRNLAIIGIDAYVAETLQEPQKGKVELRKTREAIPYKNIRHPKDWLGIEHFVSFQHQAKLEGLELTRNAAITAFRMLIHRFPRGSDEYQLDGRNDGIRIPQHNHGVVALPRSQTDLTFAPAEYAAPSRDSSITADIIDGYALQASSLVELAAPLSASGKSLTVSQQFTVRLAERISSQFVS